MDRPTLYESRRVAPDTEEIPGYVPVASFGVLAINAFLIHAAQPVLVDTGAIVMRDDFLEMLQSIIKPEELRWVWLTHTDPDHIGGLVRIMEMAPKARVITTFLGMGKMGLHRLPTDRVFLLNPGQSMDAGDRRLLCLKPPTYDAPETTALLDMKTRVLFSADCFGALLREPAPTADRIVPGELREGLITWSTVDSPWIGMVNREVFGRSLDGIRELDPSAILSSHLPPAPRNMTGRLLEYLSGAPDAPQFVGPDQAMLEQSLVTAGTES